MSDFKSEKYSLQKEGTFVLLDDKEVQTGAQTLMLDPIEEKGIKVGEIHERIRENFLFRCPQGGTDYEKAVRVYCLQPDPVNPNAIISEKEKGVDLSKEAENFAMTIPTTATSPTTPSSPTNSNTITLTAPTSPTSSTPTAPTTPTTSTITPTPSIFPTIFTIPTASTTSTSPITPPTLSFAPTAGVPQTQTRVGLDGVIATRTKLSLVDGKNGVLIIGGYPVEEIAHRISLEEAALLLWTGELPSADAALTFRKELALLGCRALRAETLAVIRAARDAPPIDALRMACATLSLDVLDPNDITPAGDVALAKRLLACFPAVVAAHSRLRQGLEPIAPRADLGLAANFLYMAFGTEPEGAAVKALETYWVTVCDHAMNASTFAARVIASTRSDMVSAVTGAVGALKGPLHGGAPGPVLDMLREMKTADAAEAWLRREIAEGRRVMGFGHRIYKVRDPRAEVLARTAEEMAGANIQNAELYRLARVVEKTALRVLEELKPGRNLKTNVEFYTALVLQSIGLESDQFVSVFACGRVAGWCAHVREQHEQDHLLRPQSEYVGPRRSFKREE